MEYGVDRTFDNHHQVDEYNSNDQFVLPPFSMERAQDFSMERAQDLGLYYEQESPLAVETVSDYVPEQQTVYYSGSTGSFPAYSPQQSEGTYAEGPTADSELDQLLQQPYEYQYGAYTVGDDIINMIQPQEQNNPFGRDFPKDEVLDDLLEEVIKDEEFNVTLPELSTPESILEDVWNTARVSQLAILEEAIKNFNVPLPELSKSASILEYIQNTAILSQGAILEQYGAAVVSPLDSGCSIASSSEYSDIPVTVPQGEHSPTSFQELFDSVAQDEATNLDIQETQAVIMYIDEHGTLRPYEPTVTIAPTPSKPVRKRGRKPLPKAPVTESEFYCLPCNKVFKRHRGLLQHNHYHHSGPKEHQCAQCGKKYPTLERLQSHVQKHNDAFKPYGCSHCTKRFSHPHDMKRHIWTSHGEAPFSCSFCDKRFGRLDHVEQHEISHKNNTVIVKK